MTFDISHTRDYYIQDVDVLPPPPKKKKKKKKKNMKVDKAWTKKN